MRKNFIATMLMISVFALYGCYLEGPDYTEELDLVYTNYDNQFDFASKGTYDIADEVVKITGDPTAPPEYIRPIYSQAIIDQINANMAALGWTLKDANVDSVDVHILPAVWTTTTLVGGYWGGYYCWWYPYYCGGGWYYPYTPVTSYTTGTMLITMVDAPFANEGADGSKRVVWSGAMNGLLSGTYDVNRLNKGIDQAFAQSPYLKTN